MNPKNSIHLSPMSRDQIRSVDKIAIESYGISGLVLMENAGRGAAELIANLSPSGELCILCGKGNNGGDGYVIARHLESYGRVVRIVSLVDVADLAGDAAVNHEIARLADISISIALSAQAIENAIADAAVLIDCMLGTGAVGEPREPFRAAIEICNRAQALRIAIDVPSGLDCDSGEPSHATFRADHTLTFVAEKNGFGKASATEYLGQLHVLPIGVPAKLLRQIRS